MATSVIWQPRTQEISYRDNLGRLSSGQHFRASISLYFPADTLGMATRFRKRALTYIYRTALALSEERLESAAVSVSSQPDEEDSLTIDLTLTVDARLGVHQESETRDSHESRGVVSRVV